MLLALVVALIALIVTTLVGRALRQARVRRHERIRSEIRPAIVAVLVDPEADVTLDIARGRASADLFDVLASEYLAKVRGESRQALVRVLADRGAVAAAERRVGRPGGVGRLSALQLLGRCGLARSRAPIETLLRHRNPEMRAAAARALGHLGDPDAIPALIAATRGDRSVAATTAAQAIVRIGPSGAPKVRAALDDPDNAVRAVAATVLGLLQSVEAVPALCDVAANDGDIAVRQRAVRSLGIIGDPRAVECLTAATTQPLLAADAAEALGGLGAPESIATLLELMSNDHHDIAFAAAHALTKCGPGGVEALRRRRRDEGPGAPYAAAELARLGLARREAPEASAHAGAASAGEQ